MTPVQEMTPQRRDIARPSNPRPGIARRDVATIEFFNTLIETVLQGLSPSETKLLLLVTRQTLGWTDGRGGHKAEDWMTNRYLQDRCTLSHTSVSRAIESLLKKKLIEVRDESGQLLLTPAERRRSSRLFFSLVSSPSVSLPSVQDSPGVQDSPTVQDPLDAEDGIQKSGKLLANVQADTPINSYPMQTNGFQKLETTNKIYINKNINHDFVVSKTLNASPDSSMIDAYRESNEPLQYPENVQDQALWEGVPLQIEHLEVLGDEDTFIAPQRDELHTDTRNGDVTNENQTDENQNEDIQPAEDLKLPQVGELKFGELSDTAEKVAPPNLSDKARQVIATYRQQLREHLPDTVIPKAVPSDFEKLESYFGKHPPQVVIKLLPTFFTVDYDFNSRNQYSLHAFVHSVNILLYGMRRLSHFAKIKRDNVESN